MVHQKRRRPSEALEALRKSLHAPPQDVFLCFKIGDALRAHGHFSDALEAFRRACTLEPDSAEAYHRLGAAYLEMGASREAAEHLEIARSLEPTAVPTRIALATALIALRQHDQANALLDQLIVEGTGGEQVFVLIAKLAREQARSERAVWALEQALRLCPGALHIKSELGVSLVEAGQHDAAIELLQQVADALPQASDPLINLAMALHEAGRREQALEHLELAIKRSPRSAAAHSNHGIVLQAEGQLEAAVRAFRLATGLAPEWAVPYFNLGLALAEAGQINEALGALERARQLEPADEAIAAELDTLSGQAELDGGSVPATRTFSGSLKLFSVADLLEFLRINRRTGTLRLGSDGLSAVLAVVDGRLSAAGAPASDLSTLLRQEGVDLAGCAPVPSSAPIADQAFAVRLRQARVVDDEQLRALLRRQIDEVLLQVLSWTQGHFAFEATDSPEDALDASFHFEIEAMLLDAFRRIDEAQR